MDAEYVILRASKNILNLFLKNLLQCLEKKHFCIYIRRMEWIKWNLQKLNQI